MTQKTVSGFRRVRKKLADIFSKIKTKFKIKNKTIKSKGITPINSFENDFMDITPVDDSQIDNSNN